MIFIRIKVKGYLKNNTENEITSFEVKGIKDKSKIIYSNDDVKNIIKIKDNEIILTREGDNFTINFLFSLKKSSCNYLLKDKGYDIDIDIKTTSIDIKENYLFVTYEVIDSKCTFEYKIEMSEIL